MSNSFENIWFAIQNYEGFSVDLRDEWLETCGFTEEEVDAFIEFVDNRIEEQ